MQLPILVLGRSTLPAILRHGAEYFDDDQVYDFVGRSDPFLPAGLGGEAAFYTIYVTTTHFTVGSVLKITPRIDGLPLASTVLVLNTAPGDEGEQRIHEVSLSKPYVSGGLEMLRNAPRGSWIDVTIETQRVLGAGVADRLIVDGVEVEFETVQEGKQPVVSGTL